MKNEVTKFTKRQGLNLYERTNLNMVEPMTPAVIKGLRTVYVNYSNNSEAVYGPENSIHEFVDHWLANGWKMNQLLKAYKKLYITSYAALAGSIVTICTMIMYIIRTAGTDRLSYFSIGCSICVVIMFGTMFLSYNMHMWRIRNHRLNAKPWVDSIKADWKTLIPAKLPSNYIADLKERFQNEKPA